MYLKCIKNLKNTDNMSWIITQIINLIHNRMRLIICVILDIECEMIVRREENAQICTRRNICSQ